MLFDTTFRIDLEREARQQREGAATRFLIGHPAEALAVSIITTGEFAEGYAADGQAACWAALSLYAVLDLDRETVWLGAQLSRDLRSAGLPIGDNDIWIAATALRHGLTLVTRNAAHFGRVAGLLVLSY
jgi:predicted nucleic acid-binding protein